MKTTWVAYQERQADLLILPLCLHLPYPKLALKGLNKIIPKDPENKNLTSNFEASITYNRQIGNIYTGSLYLGLFLLEQSQDFKPGGELPSYLVLGCFKFGCFGPASLRTPRYLCQRQQLSVADYEKLFYEEAQLDDTGSTHFANYQTGAFRLAKSLNTNNVFTKEINMTKLSWTGFPRRHHRT